MAFPFSRFGRLGRTYRHAQRYRQILTVFLRYGLGDLVDSARLDVMLDLGNRPREEDVGTAGEGMTRAERVRRALEELGPTFVKLGQVMAPRRDLLPASVIGDLSSLQDQVPPFPFAEARRILERELEAPVGDVFAELEEVPLAAASIGQVHAATRPDGSRVVVKVQRPGIEKTVEVDLEILRDLAALLERRDQGWNLQRPTELVEELARHLRRELDYRNEAANLDRLAWQFESDAQVTVPAVHHDLTTPRVLVMDRMDGVKPADAAVVIAAGLDPRKVAARCAALTMRQIFLDGFFHADPHPGNIFVLPDHGICYLDLGQVGRIGRTLREAFADLLAGVVARDERAVAAALLDLTEWQSLPRSDAMERDVGEFLDRHFYRPLEDLELSALLRQLLEIAGRHQLRIPPEAFLVIKAISSVEGLCRNLDPHFEITEHAAPFVRRLRLRRLRPDRVASEALELGADALSALRGLPREAQNNLRLLRKGRTRIGFELLGLDPLGTSLDRVANRLAFAIVLAALVVGSSLLVLAGTPPTWHGIPMIGLGGYLVAAVMGFWLLVSILKHGKM